MPLCFLRAKPIGVMQMIDQGEQVCAGLAIPLFRWSKGLLQRGRVADSQCKADGAV